MADMGLTGPGRTGSTQPSVAQASRIATSSGATRRPSGDGSGGVQARTTRAPRGYLELGRLRPEVDQDEEPATVHGEPVGARLDADPPQVVVAQVGLGAAQGDERPVPGEHPRVRLLAQLGPVEHARLAGRRVLRVGHVLGVPAVLGELRAGGRRGRRRPSSGSGKSVKNCHGVDAAHSSPMKIIGVNADVR